MKRIIILILILLLALPAFADFPDDVIDVYNMYADIFHAPAMTGMRIEIDRFCRLYISRDDFIVVSNDRTYAMIELPESRADDFLRASVSIICALSTDRDYTDIVTGVAFPFFTLSGNVSPASDFFVKITKNETTRYYQMSAIRY